MSIVGESSSELIARLQRGEVTSSELLQQYFAQIDRHDESIGAFLHIDRDDALAQAAAVDHKRASGKTLGVLAGLPVSMKDVVCQRGQPCRCGSKMLDNFVPPYDATIIQKLRDADAVIFGRTNMDEFAMGSTTENSAYRVTHNPWKAGYTPGGSSGGAAASVAAMMSPLAIGSDTGGSIRQPASFCGVVGMKPTYGRVSRYGLVAYASSLDQLGPMSHDVQGAARLLQAIAGHDSNDSTSINRDVPDYLATLEQPLEGLRIGVVKEYQSVGGLNADVATAQAETLDVYRTLGAEIKEISLPHAKYAVATYYIIAPAEASSNLSRYDGVHFGHRTENPENLIEMYCRSRAEGFGTEVKRRIIMGTYTLSAGYYDAYYLKALQVRRLIKQDFDHAFADVDVILSPVAPSPAYKLGELVDDPMAMYLSDVFTLTANLAGLPAISFPAGMSGDGLPIGLQLLGPILQEEKLLRAARMFEQATEWHMGRPDLGVRG